MLMPSSFCALLYSPPSFLLLVSPALSYGRYGSPSPFVLSPLLLKASGVVYCHDPDRKRSGARIMRLRGPEQLAFCLEQGRSCIDNRDPPGSIVSKRLRAAHGADLIYDPVGGSFRTLHALHRIEGLLL